MTIGRLKYIKKGRSWHKNQKQRIERERENENIT